MPDKNDILPFEEDKTPCVTIGKNAGHFITNEMHCIAIGDNAICNESNTLAFFEENKESLKMNIDGDIYLDGQKIDFTSKELYEKISKMIRYSVNACINHFNKES